MNIRILVVWMSLGMVTPFAPLTAATLPELTPSREAEMALSAAPEHLRDGAAVYILGEQGFRQVKEGTNGFSCLVQREGPVLAPTCFDAEGSRTTLPALRRQAELRAAGKSPQEVKAIVAAEYESGKLKAPQGPGIAYMLSPDFLRVDPKTGETRQVFPPHVMFYAPYKTNADFGFPEDARGPEGPFVLSPGEPTAYVIVVPPEHHPH